MGPEVINLLTTLLDHQDIVIRVTAVTAIGVLSYGEDFPQACQRTLPRLEEIAKTGDTYFMFHVMNAMLFIGGRDDFVAMKLEHALADADVTNRLLALNLLDREFENIRPAMPGIVKAIATAGDLADMNAWRGRSAGGAPCCWGESGKVRSKQCPPWKNGLPSMISMCVWRRRMARHNWPRKGQSGVARADRGPGKRR